ncbi:MAG: hypothetical protein Kow0059_14150 [Candidatus Sumerlaeia bacterium]
MPIFAISGLPPLRREREVEHILLEDARSGLATQTGLLTPTEGWAHVWRTRLAQHLPAGEAIRRPFVRGWSSLIGDLIQTAGIPLKPASDAACRLVTLSLLNSQQAPESPPRAGNIGLAGWAAHWNQLFTRLTHVVLSCQTIQQQRTVLLKRDVFDPAAIVPGLLKIIQGPAPEELAGLKSGRLAWSMYQSYVQALIRRGQADRTILESLLAVVLSRDHWIRAGAPAGNVFMLGFDDLTPAQQVIFEMLSEWGANLEFLLDKAPEPGRRQWPAQSTLDWIRAAGGRIGIEPADSDADDTHPFKSLSRCLFTHTSPPRQPAVRLTLMPCLNRFQEAGVIGRLVKERLSGASADRAVEHPSILIMFARLQEYASLIQDTFERLHIRFRISGGEPLASQPLIRAAMGLLGWAAEDFSAGALRAVLMYPYVRLTGEGNDPLTASDVERLAQLGRVSAGGVEAWKQGLNAARDVLVRSLERLIQDGWQPEDRSFHAEEYQRQLNDDLKLINEKGKILLDVAGELAALQNEQTAEEWTARCRSILTRFIRIEPETTRQGERADVWRQMGLERAALKTLQQILDDMTAELAPGDERFDGNVLWMWLKQYVADANFYPGGILAQDVPPVLVTTPSAARGRECDTLILGGMVEGEFPGLERRNALLAAEDDPAVRTLMPGPSARERHSACFVRLLGQTRREVIATYPLEAEGEPLMPSTFLQEALRQGVLVETSPPPDVCSSPDESGDPERLATRPTPADARETWLQWGRLSESGWRRLDAEWRRLSFEQQKAWLAVIPALPAVLQAARVEEQRAAPTDPGPWEGVLSGDVALVRYLSAAYARHVFSPTELERLAACGMRFFFEQWLNLSEKTVIEEKISPLESGTALHQILQMFFEEKMSRPDYDGRRGVVLSQADRAQDEIHLRRIGAEVLDQFPYSGIAWDAFRRQLIGDDDYPGDASGRAQKGTLRLFLDFELLKMTRCRPWALEVPFGRMNRRRQGKTSKDSRRSADPIGTMGLLRDGCFVDLGAEGRLEFRGRMDRIDLVDNDGVAVWDYKSGGVRAIKDVKEGFALQAAMYALALEQALDELRERFGAELHVVCSGYYVIKPDKVDIPTACVGVRPVKSARKTESLDTAESQTLLRRHLTLLIRQMKNGVFAHTRDSQFRPCRYCAFSQVCRINKRKLAFYTAIQGYETGP